MFLGFKISNMSISKKVNEYHKDKERKRNSAEYNLEIARKALAKKEAEKSFVDRLKESIVFNIILLVLGIVFLIFLAVAIP